MKKIVLLLVIVALFTACQGKESNDLWGPQMENIQWGMSFEEIQKYYECSKIVQEVAPNILYVSMEKPIKIFDCDMDITLILETGYGLVGIKGQTENFEKLEENIDKNLGEFRSGTELSNGLIWQSELVMERYTYQQLADAYNQVYGEGVFTESFIKGIHGSPFVSYELKIIEENKGELWLNGSKLVYLDNLFDNFVKGGKE